MHILMLNHNVARRGGTFYRAYNVGRHLTRRGHTVTLLTISEKRRFGFRREVSEGVEMVYTPDLLWGIGRTGWDPWDALNRVVYLRGQEWDIIHAWDSRPAVILPALYARRQSRKVGGKLVIDWCDWWGRGGGLAKLLYAPVETYFEEAFRTQADGTTVISQALFERALRLGVRANTMRILPQGSDVEGIVPLNQPEARNSMGMRQGAPVLGYVGRMFERDAELMIRAFEMMLERDGRIKLLLIGNSNVRVPRKLIESGSVIVTGSLSYKQLREYIACCDVMLLPLRDSIANRGRWPSKLNDYLASGKPVVATRVGDVASLVEEGSCGLLTQDTPEDFASKTLEILSNPGLLEEMGRNARETAEAKLDWRLLTQRLEQFYLRIVNAG